MKMFSKVALLASAALMMISTVAAAQEFDDVESNGNLHLRGYGSFFIEGEPKLID